MEREVAEDLYAACERALTALTQVEMTIGRVSDRTEQSQLLEGMSKAMTELLIGVRLPVVRQYPELNSSSNPQDALPYVPSDEEIAMMRAASRTDAMEVDALILRECKHDWQKVAKIVGDLIPHLDQAHPHLPVAYLQARMDHLEEAGKVEIVGDVWAMGYSEIRLVHVEAGGLKPNPTL